MGEGAKELGGGAIFMGAIYYVLSCPKMKSQGAWSRWRNDLLHLLKLIIQVKVIHKWNLN